MRPSNLLCLIATVTVLTSTLACEAQDNPAYTLKTNELNISYNRYFELGVNPPLNIGYKRIYEKGALRIASGFSFNSDSHNADLSESKGAGYTFSPQIGYEFYHWFGRIKLQYGSDLKYTFWRNDSDYNNGDPSNPQTRKIIYNKYSVRPFIGLTFFIHESFSLSTETYLDIEYYSRIDEHSDAGVLSSGTRHGANVFFGPLGVLSFTYHF